MSSILRLLLLATVTLTASCDKSPVTSSAPSVTAADGAVRLQWNPVNEPGVNGYRVYYGNAARDYVQPYGQGVVSAATTATITGLPGGRRYFFAVTATNSLGKESGFSAEAILDLP